MAGEPGPGRRAGGAAEPFHLLADAVAAGQIGPGADSDQALDLLSTLIAGVFAQHLANEPNLAWGQGRFTPLFPRLMQLFTAAYPVPAPPART